MSADGSGDRFTLIAAPGGEDDVGGFARAVRTGLSARPKALPCRYLYDQEGSRLFEEICTLDEYYLPRAEREILEAHAGELAALVPAGTTLVELGSGSARKTRIVIEALLARAGRLRFVPIDVSRSMLEDSSAALLADYPGLEIVAVAGEYQQGLARLGAITDGGPRLILWLGSNIGNFDRAEAAAFLRRVRSRMTGGDRMLVGADLRKERAIIEPAYDDAAGVTARFSKNLLARINRELGGEFDCDAFRHRAAYQVEAGRVEIHLVSERAQRVRVGALDLEVDFEPGETIHIEDSYKWSPAELAELARAAGFRIERPWTDRGDRFSESLLAPI